MTCCVCARVGNATDEKRTPSWRVGDFWNSDLVVESVQTGRHDQVNCPHCTIRHRVIKKQEGAALGCNIGPELAERLRMGA